jgi:hypothetical protein
MLQGRCGVWTTYLPLKRVYMHIEAVKKVLSPQLGVRGLLPRRGVVGWRDEAILWIRSRTGGLWAARWSNPGERFLWIALLRSQ